ncbi:hypothetical protein LLH00_00580 [bacterium]|nr:hypothetical protein [bacterium]
MHRSDALSCLTFLLAAALAAGCGKTGVPVAESTPSVADSAAGWTRIGPGGGGSHFVCTVSPFDPDFVLSRCDMSGAQLTWDGGAHWRMFNLRTVILDFEFDPLDANTVYASNTGLYRSADRGLTWKLIYPDPKNVLAEHMVGDHAEQWYETRDGMPDGQISQVLVDPADNNRIFLGLSAPGTVNAVTGPRPGRESAKVLFSEDHGATWRTLGEVPGSQVLALFPGSWLGLEGTVTVVTDRACARLSSKSTERQDFPLPVGRVLAADGGSGAEGTLFYILSAMQTSGDSVAGGVYVSRDGGAGWTQAVGGLLDSYPLTAQAPYFKTLAVCRNSPSNVYLSAHVYIDEIYWKPQRPQRDRKFGVLRTTDAGEHWSWVYQADEDTVWSNNLTPEWETLDYGPEWGESPHSFGVSPVDPDICYVTDNRTYATRDGGKSWTQLYTDSHPDGSWSTRGIDVTTTYGVHFDPFDPQHFFISYTDIGLWHTFNGGKSWFHSLKGIPLEWINTTYWLEFDPEVRGRVFSVRSDCHDLPRLKMFRDGRLLNGQFQGGVAVSDDGGLSWKPSNAGLPPSAVCTHILLDPSSPAGSRTLYVCSLPWGVYKSVDDGLSWRAANTGLGEACRSAWRMARKPDGTLFLVVCRSLRERQVTRGAVFTSTDGAASWQPVELPAGVDDPNDLVIDPSDPERMYLSCWPWPRDGVERGGGLLRSEDGGKSWQRVFDEDAHVYAAAVDPADPATVYINTFDSAAFVSHDRGASWRKIRGYNFKYGHRPVPDPQRPGWLYLTSFGGSVFHGPAAGAPDSLEDIVDGSFLRWNGK